MTAPPEPRTARPDRYRAAWWHWAAVTAALALTITAAALLGG